MISQANIKWMSEVGGVSIEDISGALSNEKEVSLDLKLGGRIISQNNEKELKENAVVQGKELRSKELAKALGLTLDAGEKDPEKIAEKLKINITSTLEEKYKGQTPSDELKASQQKTQDLEAKNEKLLTTYEESKKEVENWKGEYDGLKKENKKSKIHNSILGSFPDKMTQDKNDALLITTNAFSFEEREISGKNTDVVIDRSNNMVITNALGEPETKENVVKSFVETKGWIKGSGMNGKDRDGKQMKKGLTSEQAEKAITELGIDPGSTEGLKKFNEMIEK